MNQITFQRVIEMNKNIKVKQPMLPPHLDEKTFNVPQDHIISNCIIESCTITNDDVERLIFEQVIFNNVVFEEINWPRAELTDVQFINCDLSNADFSESILHRVEFIDCKMLGIILADATFGNVLFKNGHANLSSFGFSKMKQVIFDSCALEQTDFYECEFNKVGFDACHLNEANFANTSLTGVDLSNSFFERLQITLDGLKGCTVTNEQAVGFAKALGLRVKDTEEGEL